MSYQIGQFRRPQLDSYYTPLTMELEYQATQESTNENIVFYDVCGVLSDENILNNKNNYYLRFGIQQRIDSDQVFYLKLRSTFETEDNEQLIETYTVPRGTGIVYFENTISPNNTYNQIIWELSRTSLDYTTINQDGSFGRRMELQVESYIQLIDVLNFLKTTYSDLKYLTKIGVQGPPALLMCINGEQIKIGKTGIYELNSNINVTSISFVPKNTSNGLDYFIMDFEYE